MNFTTKELLYDLNIMAVVATAIVMNVFMYYLGRKDGAKHG